MENISREEKFKAMKLPELKAYLLQNRGITVNSLPQTRTRSYCLSRTNHKRRLQIMYDTMTDLFSDTTKFKKVTRDTTLTQLTTLQNYLRTIYNRDEITQVEYESMRPTSTKSARAHGLPKIHKTFDTLPPFRPIIDTTGTAYQPTAEFITQLLNPLTINEFTIQDSFDAVHEINNIPPNLFNDGYKFVSFDVKSLFTNIPLHKTVNIILKRIHDDKLISTKLTKRTLKKLILDSCTKTIFSLKGGDKSLLRMCPAFVYVLIHYTCYNTKYWHFTTIFYQTWRLK
jgi:hypothetical protein